MKKQATLYFCDTKDWSFLDFVRWVSKEFPNVPFEKVKPTLGIVSISFEAAMPDK